MPGAMHDAPMVGRLLAICGWLAWQVGRPFRATPLRRLGTAPVIVIAALLLLLAAAPIIAPQLEPQPEDTGVQAIFDDAVVHPEGWVRLRGRVVPLEESPTGSPGTYALLVDAEAPLRAVVLRTDAPLEAAALTVVTGRLITEGVIVTEDLPIEATVAGTPPRVVGDALLVPDPVATAVRMVWWPLAIPPALLAALLPSAPDPAIRSSVQRPRWTSWPDRSDPASGCRPPTAGASAPHGETSQIQVGRC